MLRAMLVLAVLFTGTISVTQADEDEISSYRRYAMIGTLDAVDFNNYTVVVGDVQKRLASDVRVRSPKGRIMALRQMRPGIRVGLVSDADARGTLDLVKEIHVLSARYAQHGSAD